MITVQDLRITSFGRKSMAKEEIRRATNHIEQVIIRSVQVLCNMGTRGTGMTLIEAMRELRTCRPDAPIGVFSDADRLLVQLGAVHSRTPRDRVNQLLEDVARISNVIDGLIEDYKRSWAS